MKKVALILMVVCNVVLLTGCTDQSKELEERIEIENEQQLVDPSNNGTIDDDDHREE